MIVKLTDQQTQQIRDLEVLVHKEIELLFERMVRANNPEDKTIHSGLFSFIENRHTAMSELVHLLGTL